MSLDSEQLNKAEWSPAKLGEAIREARIRKGLSITELARRSDLSQSFLSQVEIGRSDISVGRLIRIAQALHVAVADLVDKPIPGRGQLVRAGERVEIPNPAAGLEMYLLAPSLDHGRTFATGLLEPGAVTEPTFSNPGSESFILVQEGCAQIDLVDGRSVQLDSGDSISYATDEFIRLANAGTGKCHFLWVQSAFRPSRDEEPG